MICSGSGRSGGSGGSGRSAKWTAVEMSSIGVVVGANGCGHEATLNRQSTGFRQGQNAKTQIYTRTDTHLILSD